MSFCALTNELLSAFFFKYVVEHKDTIGYSEDDERLKDINAVIDTLRPKTRLVLQECYINRKSYKEVADELEISTSGVKKHIITALKTITEEISKDHQRMMLDEKEQKEHMAKKKK